jgi:hypothetical protein
MRVARESKSEGGVRVREVALVTRPPLLVPLPIMSFSVRPVYAT